MVTTLRQPPGSRNSIIRGARRQPHAYTHTNGNPNCDADANTDSNGNPDAYADCYPDTDADCHANADSYANGNAISINTGEPDGYGRQLCRRRVPNF